MPTFRFNPAVIAALFVSCMFPIVIASEGATPGVIIYTDPPGSPDELAVSLEFINVDEFDHLVNVQPAGSRVRRIMKPQVKGIIKFKDFNALTVAESKSFQELKDELQLIEQLSERFPAHAKKWAPYQADLRGVINKIQSGFALVGGGWVPIDEYTKMNQGPEKMQGDFEFEGKVYKGIRLVAVEGTEVGIIHSGGSARLPISGLNQAAVNFLNNGKIPQPIELSRVEISHLKEEFDDQITISITNATQSNEAIRSIESQLRMEAKLSAANLRTKASSLKDQVELENVSLLETRRELGTFRRFQVLQKLQGWSFAPLREAYGDNLYEIRFNDGEFALVSCPYTEFLTSGLSEMFLVPVDGVEVIMVNGFVRNSLVFREADPMILVKMAANLDLLRQVDEMRNEADGIEAEAERRIENLQMIASSFDAALSSSRINTDEKLSSIINAYRIVDTRYLTLKDSLKNGQLSTIFELVGMNPNSNLSSTDVIDDFIERLSKMEFDVAFDVKRDVRFNLFICRNSAISDPEKSLANASGWIAQKQGKLEVGPEQLVKIPLFRNESFLFSLEENHGDSDFRILLDSMVLLASKEPELNLPPQKVFQFLRAHAPAPIEVIETLGNISGSELE